MICSISLKEEAARIEIAGDLDLYSTAEFRGRVSAAVEAGARDVTVDLQRCDFVDSNGLGALMQMRSKLEQLQGSLRVVEGPQSLSTVAALFIPAGQFLEIGYR